MPASASSQPDWTRPADIVRTLRRRWDSGSLLTAFASGQPWQSLGLPIRGPAPAELAARFAEAQTWAQDWGRADPRIRVEYRRVGGRLIGANSIPGRAWIDGYSQLWALLRTEADVHRFTAALDQVKIEMPALADWMITHPLKVLSLADDWDMAVDTVRWIDLHGQPGMYVRQVDVPGVDTKFIERHRGVLAELLDSRLDPGRVDAFAGDFATRYGFARKPDYVRFRCPFRGLSEANVRVDELGSAPPGVSRVYVVENEITYLAFPRPEKAMVIWGRGYAVDALAPLRWLAELDVVYWGDIDTHGFAILSRLRGMFPSVRSMLMDRETLLAHRDQWVREPSPATAVLTGLTAEEAALYADLAAGAYGDRVRLEQERVAFGAVERAIRY